MSCMSVQLPRMRPTLRFARKSQISFTDAKDKMNKLVCVVTSDVNFTDAIKLALDKDFKVLLIHNSQCAETLKLMVNETITFDEIVKQSGDISKDKITKPGFLLVENLPFFKEVKDLFRELSKIFGNCGGEAIKFRCARYNCH